MMKITDTTPIPEKVFTIEVDERGLEFLWHCTCLAQGRKGATEEYAMAMREIMARAIRDAAIKSPWFTRSCSSAENIIAMRSE